MCATRGVVTALVLAAIAGCRGKTMAPPNADGGEIPFCKDDTYCGGTPCLMGVCVPRPSTTLTWAAEIIPAPSAEMDGGTVPAPMTEQTGVTIGVDLVPLTAKKRDVVSVSFSSPGGAGPQAATVQLTVASEITGRPDLTFQAQVQAGNLGATLYVPEGIFERQASVSFLPRSDDQTTPPQTFVIDDDTRADLVAASKKTTLLVLPPLALETGVPVRGTLQDSAMQPKGGFSARALQAGVQVSTRGLVDASGKFTLLVPAAIVAASGPTTIQFDPASGSSDPWLTKQYQNFPDSIDAHLATYPATTNFFGIPVQPKEDSNAVVAGALVRARVVLGDDGAERTTFVRDGVTDDMRGVATFSLLPGLTTLIPYTFQISPPPASKYATACRSIPVGVGINDATAALLPTVQLDRRPVLSGVVLSAYNVKVPGVVVTATLLGPAPDPDPKALPCPPIGGPITAVTDASGAFKLTLDRGIYQLDYDPPPGGPWPRLTEESLLLDTDLVHDVVLSAGEVIYGKLTDDSIPALPLAGAVVRLYEPRSDAGGAPFLRAQVQTGADGTFMAVVPAPALKR